MLPKEYALQCYYENAAYVKHNKSTDTYSSSCVICREGKSFGKKRRCFYIPKNDLVYCHNCGWSSNALTWIQRVTGKDRFQILDDAKSHTFNASTLITTDIPKKKASPLRLPADSINLCDQQQLDFYTSNKVIKEALNVCKKRRLLTAVNRPDAYYISLSDFTHKNRLVIPFYNTHNKIVFYQSRSIGFDDKVQLPKYLGKTGGERTLFGINKVSSKYDEIVIHEGPINATFTPNGVAVAGINKGDIFTNAQQKQFHTTLAFFKPIWMLDNQRVDITAREKTEKLINDGHNVFIWPEKLRDFKDVNDFTIHYKIDEFPIKLINKFTFSGVEAVMQLQKCY